MCELASINSTSGPFPNKIYLPYLVVILLMCNSICLRMCKLLCIHVFQVVIPKTYQKYTSRKVLTTGWIDGEKLSQSTESDVGELVNVGVICYLKQVKYYY